MTLCAVGFLARTVAEGFDTGEYYFRWGSCEDREDLELAEAPGMKERASTYAHSGRLNQL